MGTSFFNLEHKCPSPRGDVLKVDIILNNFWHIEERKQTSNANKKENSFSGSHSSHRRAHRQERRWDDASCVSLQMHTGKIDELVS